MAAAPVAADPEKPEHDDPENRPDCDPSDCPSARSSSFTVVIFTVVIFTSDASPRYTRRGRAGKQRRGCYRCPCERRRWRGRPCEGWYDSTRNETVVSHTGKRCGRGSSQSGKRPGMTCYRPRDVLNTHIPACPWALLSARASRGGSRTVPCCTAVVRPRRKGSLKMSWESKQPTRKSCDDNPPTFGATS